MRPFRSVLYMPGSNPRALAKAATLPADALILDLEDAVAPDAKEAARDLIVDAVNSGDLSPRYVMLRCNGLDTEWGEGDIASFAKCSADAVLLPKVNGANDIHAALALMDKFGVPETTEIWAMMETPASILNAREIAHASPRLGGFVVGTNDLLKDMYASYDPARTAVAAALSICVLAARDAGISVVDGVFNAIKDADGLKSECDQGRVMGFDGKSLIHPAQIETTNAVFGPSKDDLELARRYVEAFDEAIKNGKAVAVVDGRIVENLHVDNANRLLAMAEKIDHLNAATN